MHAIKMEKQSRQRANIKARSIQCYACAANNSNLALNARQVVVCASIEEEDDTTCPVNDFEEDLTVLLKKYSGTMTNKEENLKRKSTTLCFGLSL